MIQCAVMPGFFKVLHIYVGIVILAMLIACAPREEGTFREGVSNPISRQFRVDFQKTWQAVLSVLAQNRYVIASAEQKSGLISTQWKDVGFSETRGLFRKKYPIKARLTIWVKARGADTFVTVTSEERIILSEKETEPHRTTTEIEHEILEQVASALGVRQ